MSRVGTTSALAVEALPAFLSLQALDSSEMTAPQSLLALLHSDGIGGIFRVSTAVLLFLAIGLSGKSRQAVQHRIMGLGWRLRGGVIPRTGVQPYSSSARQDRNFDNSIEVLESNPLAARRGFITPEPTHRGPAGLLALLGRRLSAAFGAEDEDEVFLGASAVVAAAFLGLYGPISGLVIMSIVVVLLRARRRARKRLFQARIDRNLPEVIDLLGLVVAAGLPTITALNRIAGRVPEPFRAELSEVMRRSAAGEPFVESLRRLRFKLGCSVTPLIYAMTAAEIDGVPLGPALERAGDEAHRRRRVRAEETARRVPVLMLFPLVFCILPAFCCLTVVPILVGAIADLQLPNWA